MSLYDLTLRQFLLFLLVLFRVGGLMFIAPFFGAAVLPPQAKIGLSLFVAIVVFPTLAIGGLALPESVGAFALAAALETGVGVIIGFVATLFFVGVQLAGMLVDQELGLSLANVIDPVSAEQTSVVGQLKFFLATLFFLALDGHHYLLSAVIGSFHEIPLLGLSLQRGFYEAITDRQVQEVLEAAIRISAPTVVALLLTTVGMGFVARIAPEMNMFVLVFSIRLVVGLGIVLLSIPVFAYVFDKDLSRFLANMPNWIRLMH